MNSMGQCVDGDFQAPDLFLTLGLCAPIQAASCQSRVASCQFRSPVHTRATHQSHSAHHVSLGSDPKRCQPGVKKARECGWMHCFGEGNGSEKQETGTSSRQSVLDLRSSFSQSAAQVSSGMLAGEDGGLNKERRRNPQPGLIVATALRHQRRRSTKRMGLLGQKKWSSRIRSAARAAQGKWYLTEPGHVQPPPPFQSLPSSFFAHGSFQRLPT